MCSCIRFVELQLYQVCRSAVVSGLLICSCIRFAELQLYQVCRSAVVSGL